MNKGWEIKQMHDIADIVDSRHKTPNYSDVGFPMVRAVDINNGILNLSGTRKVSELVYKDFSKGRNPQIGDILISRVGHYLGKVSFVSSLDKFCMGQNIALIIPAESSKFLFYFLKSPFTTNQIEMQKVGAAQPTLSLKSIKELHVYLPPLPEQKAIAHILGTLDDKIELNRQMNETLEEMAQVLFKSWFVDFDLVIDKALAAGNEIPESLQKRAKLRKELGNIRKPLPEHIQKLFPDRFVFTEELGWVPEGWESAVIADFGDVIGGGTPSTKVPEYYSESEIPWLSPKDLSGFKWKFISKGEKDISELGLEKSSARLLPEGTVLFSSRAPIGYLAIAKNEVSTNQGFKSIVPAKKEYTNYLFYFLKSNVASIEAIASGSTFKEISGSALKNYSLIKPEIGVLRQFENQITDFNKKFNFMQEQSSVLTSLRDSLVPKLISGELRVPEAEKLITDHV